MKALFLVALLAFCAASASAADIEYGTCATTNMSSVFQGATVVMTPTTPSVGDVLRLEVAGNFQVPVAGVTSLTSTGVCIFGVCIPVDTRVVSCANDSCDFAAGAQTVVFTQTLPSIAPAGTYQVTLKLQGVLADGTGVTFTCNTAKFQIV